MSLRSHLLVACIPLAAWLGGEYAIKSLMEGKAAELYRLDIGLAKQALRTCGAEKLRTSSNVLRVSDDNVFGGLFVDLKPSSFGVQLIPVSSLRTRIQVDWPMRDHTPNSIHLAEGTADSIAELLLPCTTLPVSP